MEEQEISPGVNSGVCLVVDTAVMDSMTSEEPWIYVLDLLFDLSSPVPEGEYLGYFRAIDLILTELYPMLPVIPLDELWFADGRIWVSVYE